MPCYNGKYYDVEYWIGGTAYYVVDDHNNDIPFRKLHRDIDLPAFKRYYSGTDKLCSLVYYKNGNKHRDDDKPAFMHYIYNNEIIITDYVYFKFDFEHRELGKPSTVYSNGELYYCYFGIRYCKNDKNHKQASKFVKDSDKNPNMLLLNLHHNNDLIKVHCRYKLGLLKKNL